MNLRLQLRRRSVTLMSAAVVVGCTYGPPAIQSHIANVSRAPNSRTLAVMVMRTTLRSPTGLSTFPDGGSPKILSQEAVVYLCDFDGPSVRELGRYRDDGRQPLGFDAWLLGWTRDALFFQTSGCAANWKNECWGKQRSRRQFEMSLGDGAVRPADRLPGSIEQGANSPLAPIPGEQNYLRVSSSWTTIDVTTSDANGFRPALVLQSNGTLSLVQ